MPELLRALDAWRVRAARGTGKTKVSLRDLQARTRIPRSSLSAYLTGTTPMPVDVLDAIVLALGATPVEARGWATVWERVMVQAHSAGPAQLPPPVPGFTGRAQILAALDGVKLPVILISGTAGVGKTSLAVHWGHKVSRAFPDGQLHANLRGFDPAASPTDPSEVLTGFLELLGVATARIPSTMDAKSALYRALLSGKRVLVLLDNAYDAEQVRPLLPGGTETLTLVTSRNRLTSLVVSGDAHPVVLDPLSPAESLQLWESRVGVARIAAEPQAAQHIIDRCAGLPLALAIVAARAVMRPDLALADLSRPADLTPFSDTDPAADLRAVFSQSYRDLGEPAARLFRLLGLHPGQDFSLSAAASLAGLSVADTRPLITALVHANLLNDTGRFGFHDLLRAYALELADADAKSALTRLADYYLHTAFEASALVHPQRRPIIIGPALPDVTAEALTDREAALHWFKTESSAVVRVIGQAAKAGLHAHVWQTSWAVADFFLQFGHWTKLVTTQTLALRAAEALQDSEGQARAHSVLARAHTRLGQVEDALAHFQATLSIYEQRADLAGQAHTHLGLNWLLSQNPALYAQTLPHSHRAVELFQQAGDRLGTARALNSAGWAHVLNGDYQGALELSQQAQVILATEGHVDGEAHAWDSIAYAQQHLGDYTAAVTGFERAIELFRSVENGSGVAETLIRLGDAHAASGEHSAASAAWAEALSILDGFGDPRAEDVRLKLRS